SKTRPPAIRRPAASGLSLGRIAVDLSPSASIALGWTGAIGPPGACGQRITGEQSAAPTRPAWPTAGVAAWPLSGFIAAERFTIAIATIAGRGHLTARSTRPEGR